MQKAIVLAADVDLSPNSKDKMGIDADTRNPLAEAIGGHAFRSCSLPPPSVLPEMLPIET